MLGIGDTEQGAGMPHIYFLLGQTYLYLARELEEAQVVADRGALLAHSGAEFLLCEVVRLYELLVGQRDFDGVEVFALDVFHLHHMFVLFRLDVCRQGGHTGHSGRTPAAFSGDDHIVAGGLLQ